METLKDYLLMQNPHWQTEEYSTGIPREFYLNKIIRILDHTKEITIISGVRRAGKTTLMKQTIRYLTQKKNIHPKQILSLSCDTALLKGRENPLEDCIEQYKLLTGISKDIWLFFDEVQEIENFPLHIKNLYDSGQYHLIISGSTSHILTSKSGTYLTGRYIPVHVYPLSFAEYLAFKSVPIPKSNLDELQTKYQIINWLRTYLTEGGFPAVISIDDETLRNDLLKAYYDSIVYRDIIASHSVKNPGMMLSLLTYLISNTSNLQSFRKLAELFKSDPKVIQDYISYASDGNLISAVTKFSYSYKKQIIAQKKMYCIDTGLRRAAGFTFSPDIGRLAENTVCIELMRRGFEPKYYSKESEIDFVVQMKDGKLLLIQVCNSDEIPERELVGFKEFTAEFPQTETQKILLTENLETEIGDAVCIPLWKWLLGAVAESAQP